MKVPYWKQLLDPRWQRKRLEIMQRSNFTCEDCSTQSQTIQIHHSYYERGLMAWDYPNESLKCLCEECHEKRPGYEHELLECFNSVPADVLAQFVLELKRYAENLDSFDLAARWLIIHMAQDFQEPSKVQSAVNETETFDLNPT